MKYILLFSALAVSSFSALAQSSEFDKMSFLIGNWKYQAKSMASQDTFIDQVFYTKCSPIFNKRAHKDDFYYKDQEGNMVCYGTTLRTYDTQTSQWKMMWVESNLSITTKMTGRYEDGKFLFDGEGEDQRGKYTEKIMFYDIEKDSYSWKMDRSYDGEKTWLKNYFSYTATRME